MKVNVNVLMVISRQIMHANLVIILFKDVVIVLMMMVRLVCYLITHLSLYVWNAMNRLSTLWMVQFARNVLFCIVKIVPIWQLVLIARVDTILMLRTYVRIVVGMESGPTRLRIVMMVIWLIMMAVLLCVPSRLTLVVLGLQVHVHLLVLKLSLLLLITILLKQTCAIQ